MKILIAMAALFSFGASASLIQTETADFSSYAEISSKMGSRYSDYSSYNVKGFDQTLGELIGIRITVDSIVNADVAINGYADCDPDCSTNSHGFADYENYIALYDEVLGDVILGSHNQRYAIRCEGDESCTNTKKPSNTIDFTVDAVDKVTLDYFLQDTFYVNLDHELKYPACFGSDCVFTVQNAWQGTITFDYEYTSGPVNVSEPSSLAVALSGLAMIMFGARRRRKN